MRLFDLHDAALYAWRNAGVREGVLVHVDAHHDADSEEWDFVTISNFVWWALKEGLAREVFWVVPDPTWETPPGVAAIRQSLETLACQHRHGGHVDAHGRSLRALVGGRPFTACALSSLPSVGEALLDIDVDYLLVPDIAHEFPPIEGAMPWIWPPDLVAALHAAGVTPAIVTVATSTRGGFTPAEWKYLGEELCARLAGEAAHGYDAVRAGVEAEQRGDLEASRAAYQEAIRRLPASAGARYRLARLHLLLGDDEAARRTFREAAKVDPSYGALDCEARRWRAAGNTEAERRVYTDALRMEPENPVAELGLAELSAARGDHARAIVHFERSLTRRETLVDAHRGIARSLEATGERTRAIRHYERSLRLELLGYPTLDSPIATRPPRMFDATHWEIHRRLAALQHNGQWVDAVDRLCRSHLQLDDQSGRFRVRQ